MGTQAASDLAKLDEDRRRWKASLDAFSRERQRILESSMSETDKQRAVEDLLAAHFEASEHQRVLGIVSAGASGYAVN